MHATISCCLLITTIPAVPKPLLFSINSIDKRFSKKKIASLLSEQDQKNFIHSSVLVPIIKKDNTLNLLFTVRSKKLKSHSGEICFPGGRWSKKDKSLVNTALRETREEIGIPDQKIKILQILYMLKKKLQKMSL